jgi:hypothetical protein
MATDLELRTVCHSKNMATCTRVIHIQKEIFAVHQKRPRCKIAALPSSTELPTAGDDP